MAIRLVRNNTRGLRVKPRPAGQTMTEIGDISYLQGVGYRGLGPIIPGSKIGHHITHLALGEEILAAAAAKTPYAHTRLGDGEAALITCMFHPERRPLVGGKAAWTGVTLKNREFIQEMGRAFVESDSLGIQALADTGEIHATKFMQVAQQQINLSLDVFKDLGLPLDKIRGVEVHAIYYLFAQPEWVSRFKDAHVLLVGQGATEVFKLSQHASWREKLGWSMRIDPSPTPKHLDFVALKASQRVVERYRQEKHDVVMIGCGAPAKEMCARLKREAGAVAIDIGHVMEGLKGTGEPRIWMDVLNQAAKTVRTKASSPQATSP